MSDKMPSLKYEGNRKHKLGGPGSQCLPTITTEIAQKLLNKGVKYRKSGECVVYNVHDGQAYEAREHRPGLYHGYPVKGSEVPPDVLRKIKERKIISDAEYKKLLKGI